VCGEPDAAPFALQWHAKENGVNPASESARFRADRVDAVAVWAVTFDHGEHGAGPVEATGIRTVCGKLVTRSSGKISIFYHRNSATATVSQNLVPEIKIILVACLGPVGWIS
jgi:hypothetical protein